MKNLDWKYKAPEGNENEKPQEDVDSVPEKPTKPD